MRLIIVTGQEGSDVENLFRRTISEHKYTYDDAHKMVFPEKSSLLHHPNSLYNNSRRVVKEHIENDEDLFILTFSDYVMYGILVEIKNYGYEDAVIHQLKINGEDVVSKIKSCGRYEYVEGVFDVIDKALDELLNI